MSNLFLKSIYFTLLIILFCSCGIQTQYEIGEVIEVFIKDEGSGSVLFSLVEHKGNTIKVTVGEPTAIDHISVPGNTHIKIRILRKLDDPYLDYEALYPYDAYREYEIGDILTGELRGEKYHEATIKSLTHHRYVLRDGNIIKLVFDDPNIEYITTTHSRFESTFIRIKILERVKNKDYDYRALYLETLMD